MSKNKKQTMDDNFYVEKEKQEFQEAKDRKEMRDGKESLGIEELAANDLGNEELHHNQKHGHRSDKIFKNHNSADDLPTTNSGPGTV